MKRIWLDTAIGTAAGSAAFFGIYTLVTFAAREPFAYLGLTLTYMALIVLLAFAVTAIRELRK